MLHIVPRESFIQELETYVSSASTDTLKEFFTIQVYKEAHQALMKILSHNKGNFFDEKEEEYKNIDEKVLKVARDHLKLKNIELSSGYFTPKKRQKNVEAIEGDLPTNIDNRVNDRRARERDSKIDPIDKPDEEIINEGNDLQYGEIDFEQHQDSEEEEMLRRNNELLGDRKSKNRRRIHKEKFKKELDRSGEAEHVPNKNSRFRSKAGGDQAGKRKKQSRFQKNTAHHHKPTETDYMSSTMRARKAKQEEIEVEEIID